MYLAGRAFKAPKGRDMLGVFQKLERSQYNRGGVSEDNSRVDGREGLSEVMMMKY